MAGRAVREQFRRVVAAPTAPLLISDGALVTADAVWAWMVLPDTSTFLLEDTDLEHATYTAAAALAGLVPAGVEFQLKAVWAPHTGEVYRESWDTVTSDRARAADRYVELGAHRIDLAATAGVLRKRVVLLGVRWPEPTQRDTTPGPSWWRTMLAAPPSPATAARDAHARLDRVRPGIARWLDQARTSALAAVPASAGLIAWAYAREVRRTDLPMPTTTSGTGGGVLAGGVVAQLCHGTVEPSGSGEFVVVTDLATGVRRWVAVLVPAAVTGFPATGLEVPGGEWLQLFTRTPGVEVSVRGLNHGKVGSHLLLDRARKVARSQIREADAVGAPTPVDAVDAEQTTEQRIAEVSHGEDVEVTVHPRWVVTASTPEELRDRIAGLRTEYHGIVDLHHVTGIQDLLWRELLPGDGVRVPEFGQEQPMRTLAGGWITGGSPFGDPTGPYMGINRGTNTDPVQLHLASRAAGDRLLPTTVVFTGMSGSGKSTSLELFVLGLLAENAWVLLPDPKGDLAGITAVARDVLGVTVQSVDATHSGAAGSMDPMRFAHTADEARTLTIDALLGSLTPDDRPAAEPALEAAIDTVLTHPRDRWSTPAVITQLTTIKGTSPDALAARRCGKTLQLRAKSPQLRAIAGTPTPTVNGAVEDGGGVPLSLLTGPGLVYLRLDGLDFPWHTTDPHAWSVPQRCSMATLRVSMAFALHQSRHARGMKKAVALPELHLLTLYPEGRQFVDWLCRVGRALQTYLLLDSQSARDLAGMTALAEQIVMAFCFRATTEPEQAAQATLLGRPELGPTFAAAFTGLRTGQCVARDRHRRLTILEFDRLTLSIAAALNTDADTSPPEAPATEQVSTETTPLSADVAEPVGVGS